MDCLTGAVVLFDVGDTLASVTISSSGDRIEELAVYPYVPGVLSQLRERGVRLGILSDRGPFPADDVNEALETCGLWDFFEPNLVIYGLKDSPHIFERAATQAGAPDRIMFVGEDPGERTQAIQAGFSVAPHPTLALPVLEQHQPLRYLRITIPRLHAGKGWRAELRDVPVLPLHVTGEAGATVYAIATPEAAARLDDLGFYVDRLGAEGEPLTSDLYLLLDDRQLSSGFLTLDGNSTDTFEAGSASANVLASTEDGLLVAVPANSSVEGYHFSGALHGHNLKLVPSAPLIQQFEDRVGFAAARSTAVAITPAESEILSSRVQPQHITGHVQRYTGAKSAGADGAMITSRHIHHTDNAVAVTTLVDDLKRIGEGHFAVHRHRFTHEGRRLENVEAELSGSGLNGVVLVTAHMDSTGARQPGYRPASDPAPGADDDASGVAGVLVAADAISALDAALQVPRRTVRFVLFNAEEHGLVGSAAYARDQALLGTPIVAALQMDMIGYDVLPEPTFEIHAGFTPSPIVEAQSLALAQVMTELLPHVSADLPTPQIYPITGERDPAERRSDHYSFQLHGYAACLASEDLFAGPSNGAPAEMNPRYHLPTDAVINAGYAADIARLVTAAAWVAATQ